MFNEAFKRLRGFKGLKGVTWLEHRLEVRTQVGTQIRTQVQGNYKNLTLPFFVRRKTKKRQRPKKIKRRFKGGRIMCYGPLKVRWHLSISSPHSLVRDLCKKELAR